MQNRTAINTQQPTFFLWQNKILVDPQFRFFAFYLSVILAPLRATNVELTTEKI